MSVLTPKPNTTIAFTDGACKGNPGPGGWGAFLVLSDGQQVEHFGGDTHTTNNQMELMGAIVALEKSPQDQKLEIWTDSSYVKNGITQWIDNWKKKGWKTAANKPVKNQQLWQRLDALQQHRDVSWHWVKGHAGHEGNEKADELANKGILASSEDASASQDDVALKKKLNNVPAIPVSTPNNKVENSTAKNSTAEIATTSNTNNPLEDDWLLDDPLGFNDVALEDTNLEPTDASDTAHSLEDRDDNNLAMNPNMNSPLDDSYLPASEAPLTEAPMAEATDNVEDEIEFDGDTSRANPHFKPLLPDPIHRGEPGRQLIMDTETTGLEALNGDRIIEVGIIELVDRKFTGEKLHVYINPQRGMDDEVIRVHGISEAFLADKPTFDKVAQKLYDFMLGAEVIAHNAPFDISFLSMEFDKVGLTDFAEKIRVTDSLVLAKQQYPGQKNTLDALVRRLNVGKMDRTFHGALLDSEILAEVYLAMTGGQVALAIDEDIQTKGAGSHANFSHLADKLLTATANFNAHLSWVAKLIKKHPNLAKTQGVTCFYQIVDAQNAPNLLLQKPIFWQNQSTNQPESTSITSATNLANYLYLAS